VTDAPLFPEVAVVDASVVIKVFLPEEGSEAATRLIQNAGSAIVRAVPDLVYLECANILWKWVRRGILAADLARESIADLRALPLQVWPSAELIELALEIALMSDVTVYDASYVALADHLDVPLITADDALVRKLGGPSERIWLLNHP
jgi:predicted nucleic acid-binding protein